MVPPNIDDLMYELGIEHLWNILSLHDKQTK